MLDDAVEERCPSTGFEVTVPGRQDCFAANIPHLAGAPASMRLRRASV